MQQIFRRANESLYSDLESYATALRRIVSALPEARALCEQVQREARLADALLAFGSGPHVMELKQALFHIGDLWPFREHGPTRTSGFSDEIAEAASHAELARKAISMLARLPDDALSGELRTCFTNMAQHLKDEQALLEECHAYIAPFSTNSDLTRKRLNLLIAAAEARLPASEDRRAAINTYAEAAELLQSWEGGVPIDDHGVAILNRCISLLGASSELFGILSVPAHSSAVRQGFRRAESE
ncbi:hypothetical protein K2Z83_04980 [Oscillochloris sp. ZM17-4]|uniref:hypothetical protein n=1 Tax=Oscillochloris sp. ZM17-4 TaxID=2866714 RepID=UPI001C7323D7|nr:hypothetical protein [Oscillochloris sp. ZM17-4]MBX0327036.1 hypothetical protein [Oscillochloris sp. ZM17-4]